jgi:hypothetical protein
MIRVFFTEDGYYIVGEGIEVVRSCSPACTERGDRIFQPLHHEYKVLYLALGELCNTDISDDVMVYGNSRIVDEVNGVVQPLDSTCERWLMLLRRNVIPAVRAVVFFRKKAMNDVQRTLLEAQKALSLQIDNRTLQEVIAAEQDRKDLLAWSNRRKILQKLRDKWFGELTNGK